MEETPAHHHNEPPFDGREALHRVLLDSISDAVFLTDDAGRFTFICPNVRVIFGHEEEEVAAMDGIAALLGEAFVSRHRPAPGEELVNLSCEIADRAGAPHTLLVNVKRVDLQSGTLLYTCRDVTERSRAEQALAEREEQLRLALDAANMGAWSVDVRTDRAVTGGRAEALLGFEPGTFGGDFDEVRARFHPEDRERVHEAVVQAGRESGGYELEFRVVGPDGGVRWLGARGQFSYDAEGRPERIAGVVMDITDRMAYEAGLIEAKERAEELNRLKDAFLANMSHEIRTPLTSILGFAEILCGELPEEQGAFVERILRGGERLQHTLDAVLDLAQLESGTLQLRPEPLDLNSEVRWIARPFQETALARGLHFTVRRFEAPALVEADRAGLQRVLGSLLSNALKFTQKGAVTVGLEVFEHEVELSVADTGIGIGEAFLPLVFDAFQQESTGLDRNYEGSGLGLAVARLFVDKMGGRIDVESRKGVGTTFRVRLPRHFAAPAAPAALHAGVEAAPRRVLVVEDNEATQVLLSRHLDAAFVLTVVATGEEALALAPDRPFDLVLLDINLGEGMGGEAVLAALRARAAYRRTPVVAVTAHALPGHERRFLDAGFDAYLAKPFTRSDLQAVLRRLGVGVR